MKRKIFAIAVMVLLAGALQGVSAQYLTSTRAGFINRVEGKVYIQHSNDVSMDRNRAVLGTQMKDGDLILTGADGYAEILLTPGSYLRLNHQTEVRALNTAFSEARFEVVKGSIFIEAGQLDKKDPIEIVTPNGPLAINKDGLLRIDVRQGLTEVSVRQGEIYLGTRGQLLAKNATKVGRGKVARLSGAASEMAKVDKDAVDDFDLWSFNRAQTLVAANYSALRRSRNIGGPLTFGWLFDPFYNCYTFIPGRGYFYSPYGLPFFRQFNDYYYYYPYGYSPWYYYGGGGGGGGNVNRPPSRIVAGHDRVQTRREFPSDRGVADFPSSRGVDYGSRGVSSGASSTVIAPSAPATVSGGAERGGGGGGARPGRP
jgi:hypothetical protein